MGWRYTYYTLGAFILFLWVVRFFVFPVHESPKFLASIGRDEEAVEVSYHSRGGVSELTFRSSIKWLSGTASPSTSQQTISAEQPHPTSPPKKRPPPSLTPTKAPR